MAGKNGALPVWDTWEIDMTQTVLAMRKKDLSGKKGKGNSMH
jgi:hypothetical protein